MEQFNLDTWLKNKSCKVVTKIGEEVKIIDTNAPEENNPIIGYIYHKQEWNGPWSWHIDGVYKYGGDDMDLFFADKDEELTEFEKELKAMIQAIEKGDFINESFDFWKNKFLNLAREELMSEISDFEIYDKGFKEGKKYALKDLPKWKKEDNHLSSGVYSIENRGNGNIVVCIKNYAIQLSELIQKLSKEK